jgi:hypothetical protein
MSVRSKGVFLFMHIERVNEPVEVLAAFRRGRLDPLALKWKGRKERIIKVNLVHTEQHGREQTHYFSVTGTGASYRLAYRPLAFQWILEEVWME